MKKIISIILLAGIMVSFNTYAQKSSKSKSADKIYERKVSSIKISKKHKAKLVSGLSGGLLQVK